MSKHQFVQECLSPYFGGVYCGYGRDSRSIEKLVAQASKTGNFPNRHGAGLWI